MKGIRRKRRGHWEGAEKREGARRERIPGRAKRPSVPRQSGGSTENDDRPLFPPSGLNYYHPAPSIVYCGGELFYYRSVGRPRMLPGGGSRGGGRRDADRRDVRARKGRKNDDPYSWFRDLLILRRKTMGSRRCEKLEIICQKHSIFFK